MPSVLIIGGARSGKSGFAQELALKLGEPVLFVATATAGDEEMAERIAQHRKARPATWSTLEATTGIGDKICGHLGQAKVVIVDCITLLVNNIFSRYDQQGEQINASQVEEEIAAEIEGLIKSIKRIDARFIIVTNELGTGLVPPSKVARLYRDLLGKANQKLAEVSEEVYLLVAGIPVRIKPS
ncbi:bifunctional adenosylcobinamide kinase/adenosylcobinamide-phosphate guanylyltransferase [Chloroflexota bacterium]